MSYTFLAARLDTGDLIAELPLIDVVWGRQLNGWGALAAKLPQRPPINNRARVRNALDKTATAPGETVVYLLRDETPLAAYRIHTRRWDIAEQCYELRGAELGHYLAFRYFGFSGSPTNRTMLRTHTGRPIAVAKEMLGIYASSFQLDLSGVTTPGGGPTITVEYRLADGKTIADVLTDLSKAEGASGFDWRIDLARTGPGTFARRMAMAPTLGGDVGLIAKITRPFGTRNVISGSVTEGDRRANFVTALGAGDAATRVTAEANSTAFTPRTSTIITYSQETDEAVLQARADARLRAVENLAIPEIELRSDNLDAQLGTFVPGDVGQIVVEAGADAYWPDGARLIQRVIGYQVTVPNEGAGETIKLSFDDPVGDF